MNVIAIEQLKKNQYNDWYNQVVNACRANGCKYVLSKDYESSKDKDIEYPKLAIEKLKELICIQ